MMLNPVGVAPCGRVHEYLHILFACARHNSMSTILECISITKSGNSMHHISLKGYLKQVYTHTHNVCASQLYITTSATLS